MPLTHFICPDKEMIAIGDCLQRCRMGRRCLTLPTLVYIAGHERPYDGRPQSLSTTRLLNGTMLEYLRITKQYATDPKDRAFSLLGSSHHERLALYAPEASGEVSLSGGTLDLIEPAESNDGSYVLTDYKTYGSYKVSRLLGLEKKTRLSATKRYQRSGKWGKAGDPVVETYFVSNPAEVDNHNEALQLNHYRVMVEAEHRIRISRLQLQVTVRDGGTRAAISRGVVDNIYMVEIPILADDYVRRYFETKWQALWKALEEGTPPNPCNDYENWNKRRCTNYCDVARFCPLGKTLVESPRPQSEAEGV